MDMESYYSGQKDMINYLYELLVTIGINEVVEYLNKTRYALGSEGENG